jgi:hypothetical protein
VPHQHHQPPWSHESGQRTRRTCGFAAALTASRNTCAPLKRPASSSGISEHHPPSAKIGSRGLARSWGSLTFSAPIVPRNYLRLLPADGMDNADRWNFRSSRTPERCQNNRTGSPYALVRIPERGVPERMLVLTRCFSWARHRAWPRLTAYCAYLPSQTVAFSPAWRTSSHACEPSRKTAEPPSRDAGPRCRAWCRGGAHPEPLGSAHPGKSPCTSSERSSRRPIANTPTGSKRRAPVIRSKMVTVNFRDYVERSWR